MNVRLLLVICLVTCYGDAAGAGAAEAGDFLDTLARLLQAGAAFLEAVKDFAGFIEKEEAKFRAIAFVEIENLADIDLVAGNFMISLGVTGDLLPTVVQSGDKQAFAITQNKPFTGIEIAASWKIPNDKLVSILVNSYQTAAWRPSNQLGVCQQGRSGAPTTYDSWKNSNCLAKQDFKTIVHTMQCCGDDYCFQGLMSTDNHSNTTIRILPKNVKNLADEKHRDPKYQALLDKLLDIPESCSTSGTAGLSVNLALLFVTLYVCKQLC